MTKHYLLGLSLTLAAVYLVCPQRTEPAQQELRRFTFAEKHMGTEFKIVLYAPDEAVARKAARAAFDRIAELDDIMSDYKKTSELMRLCAKAGGPPVKVSRDLYNVLSRAQALAQKTDGAFDATIGPVVRLWRKARRLRRLPDDDALKNALSRVGHQKMVLNADAQTVQLLVEGMLIDLGGIAKGYAADAALEVLRRHGITRALVAASGDIAVDEPPPGTNGWKIGIGPLKNPDDPPQHHVSLQNAAVSTSGDVEQFVEIGGKRYSHIVDPRTGLGLVGRSSVSVVAKDCTTSDSLATAVSVLGAERGLELIETTPGAAALIVREREGKVETLKSKRFDAFRFASD